MRYSLALLLAFTSLPLAAGEPIDIGSRRELFVDTALIDDLSGELSLKLHHPTPREIAFQFDQPWEGSASGYPTIFQDGDLYRMYYRGHRYIIDPPPLRQAQSEVVCYAESSDGIHWTRPNLGIFAWQGSKENNIIWLGSYETHNFAPFIDTNPDSPPDERYKAIGGTTASKGLWTFKSADGIHWTRLSDKAVVTTGAFDSHNTVFWDPAHQRYTMYVRYFSDGEFSGLRSIGMSHSTDFVHWSEPVGLTYPNSPPQQMYTNQIAPYYRAPHVLFGFPTRYVARPLTSYVKTLDPVDLRDKLIKADERCGTDLTDGVFMSSRDGLAFNRWDEAFLRPGTQAANRWVYGDMYQSYGLCETEAEYGEREISLHFNEGSWRDDQARLRRYTIRLDGFVSLNAPYSGGTALTKPILFQGNKLSVNYSTSAAGSLRVELQDPEGKPIPGYELSSSDEHFGDSTEQTIGWKNGSDVGSLIGKPVRIRFELKDGDLYSYHFAE